MRLYKPSWDLTLTRHIITMMMMMMIVAVVHIRLQNYREVLHCKRQHYILIVTMTNTVLQQCMDMLKGRQG